MLILDDDLNFGFYCDNDGQKIRNILGTTALRKTLTPLLQTSFTYPIMVDRVVGLVYKIDTNEFATVLASPQKSITIKIEDKDVNILKPQVIYLNLAGFHAFFPTSNIFRDGKLVKTKDLKIVKGWFYNVGSDGHVCLGNNILPEVEDPDLFDELFWNSRFMKHYSTPSKGKFLDLLKEYYKKEDRYDEFLEKAREIFGGGEKLWTSLSNQYRIL